MIDAAPPLPTDRLKNSLEEVRASVAEQETDNRLAALLQEAVLRLLGMLMAMIEDFRAGKLVPPAPNPQGANDSDVSAASYTPAPALPRSAGEEAKGGSGA